MRPVENIQTYLYQLVHGEKKSAFGHVIVFCLYLFSFIYGNLLNFKLLMFRWGVLRRHKLDCHVISLGNITVGGTGKTPTAQRLAAAIRDMGHRVVILNRGYRAKWRGKVGVVSDGRKIYMSAAEAGDEAFLLAKNLPGVPVLIGADRAVTGKYAVERFDAKVVILDDGYQHWRLVRNLDILLIDAINMFGNSYILPRGTLREPLSHLNRADVCLLTKVDQASEHACETIRQTVAENNAHALIVESVHRPQFFIEIADWYKGITTKNVSVDEMRGKRVMAVCAIGNPASFEQTISDIGAVVADSVRFADHHDYTMAEMQSVVDRAESGGVDAIIITEKDAVKIPPEFIHSNRSIPVYMLGIEVSFQDGYAKLMDMIQECLSKEN